MDWLETLPTLMVKHDEGGRYCGIDCLSRQLSDVRSSGILDSFRVKMCMVKIASETVLSLLRVDGTISSKR
jgi:chaperonin GroEL (HSP60 family)